MPVDFLQIGMDRFDLFLRQEITGHHTCARLDAPTDLSQSSVADIRTVERDLLTRLVAINGDHFPLPSLTVTGHAAGTTRILVQHLPILKLGDEIFGTHAYG